MDGIFGTWNVTRLYGSVSLKAVVIKQANCKSSVVGVGLQGIR